MAIAVLPVWRSPRINSRWPRPMGMSASMTCRPVWSGTSTAARTMMAAEGRSMGRRLVEATGPLSSRGRPSGSITRPSKALPTPTSITRPVRSTSSPACRAESSPSSTTPSSSSSRLKTMPKIPLRNLISSSKPTLGKPETLATPVPTLMIVPTSRGVSCGVNASRAWRMAANVPSNTPCKLSGSLVMGSFPRSSSPQVWTQTGGRACPFP